MVRRARVLVQTLGILVCLYSSKGLLEDDMKKLVIATMIFGVLLVEVFVGCNSFKPDDPESYPCGNPRYEWCPGRTGCCTVDEICRPNNECAPAGENFRTHRQATPDAGK